ncbi:uncharacterized protein [Hetaerina americana]|uniref:uncharacterized protein n=1 Tax=Hetaerina americana TaxID=62018 RepID=UPI003A7F613A
MAAATEASTTAAVGGGVAGPRHRRGKGGAVSGGEPLVPPVAARGLPEGATPLMYACQQGRDSDVRRILTTKPGCASDRDRTLKTALHYCAENTSPACASALLSACPSLLDACDEEGYTPVHLAVISGNRSLLRLLMDKGADVTRMDREGHSAVHWATVCGEVEALEMVIAAGANPSTPDIHGGYPVHYASQMCGANSASASADPRVGLAVLRRLLAHKVKVDVVDKDGRQPILWAASAGSADAIIALVHAGATVEAHDKDGLTALHCAASRGHTDCLETLVTLCGAEVDVIDANGCTALFYAATLGHADSTRLLLGFGAQPNRQDRKGRTAAHCGAAKGQLETLRLLVSVGGADLWIRNVRGDLPLHEAVQSGRRELVKWLLQQRPVAVNAANNDGRSPLHVAAIHNNVEMCKVLLDSHSLVNPVMRTPRGQMATPLDTALLRGNRGCAKFLQLHGGVPASKLTEESARLQGGTGGAPAGDGGSPADMYLDNVGPISARDPDISRLQMLPLSHPAGGHDTPPADGFRSEAYGGSVSRATTMYPDGHTTAASFRTTEDKFIQVNDDIAIQYVERIRLSENDGDQEEEMEELSMLRGKVSHRRLRGGEEEGGTARSRRDGEGTSEGEAGGGDGGVRRSRRSKGGEGGPRRGRSREGEDEEEEEEGGETTASSGREARVEKRRAVQVVERTPSKRRARPSGGGKSTTPVKKSPGSGHQSTSPEKSDGDDEKHPPSRIPVRKASGRRQVVVEEMVTARKRAPQHQHKDTASPVPSRRTKGEKSRTMVRKQKTISGGEGGVEEEEERRQKGSGGGKTPRRRVGDGAECEEDELQTDDDSPVKGTVQGTVQKVVAIVHKGETSEGDGSSDDGEVMEEGKVKGGAGEEDEELDEGVVVEEGPSEREERKRLAGGKEASTEVIDEDQGADQGDMGEEDTKAEEDTEGGGPIEEKGGEVTGDDGKDPGDETEGVVRPTADAEISNALDSIVSEREEAVTEGDAPVEGTNALATGSEMDDEETARADEVEARKAAAAATGRAAEADKATSESEDVTKDRTEDDVSQLAEDTVSINEGRESPSKDEGISTFHLTGGRSESQEESEVLDGASTAEADVSIETIVAAGDRKVGAAGGEAGESEDDAEHLEEDAPPKGEVEEEQEEGEKGFDRETPSTSSQFVESETVGGKESRPLAGAGRRGGMARRRREQQRIGVRVEIGKEGEEGGVGRDRRGAARETPSTSVTQAVQSTVRKYHLERHIFSELLELKRLQIRAGRANENVLVKRLVDNFHGPAGSDLTVGIKRYDGQYTFRSFEKYLYDQLRMLQSGDPHIVPKLKASDEMDKQKKARAMTATTCGGTPDNPAMCTHVTHRCHHATHAYTGIPCAAYITKGGGGGHHHHDHHMPPHHHSTSPQRSNARSTAMGSSFLPRIDTVQDNLSSPFAGVGTLRSKYLDPSRPVTLDLSQSGDRRQVISLPTQKVDKPKRYLVTFTIKPGSGSTDGVTITTKEGQVKVGPIKGDKSSPALSESPESDPTSFRHRHAKSL